MATFSANKVAVLNVVKARDCAAAERLDRQIKTYEDMIAKVFSYGDVFDCDNGTYLADLCAAMSDADRLAIGVYYNKTGDITNPRLIVGGTIGTVTINSGGEIDEINISGGANITSIVITGNTTVNYLSIKGASTVGKLSTTAGSNVIELMVSACRLDASTLYASTLSAIGRGSSIENITVDDEAIFGGLECVPIGTNTCNEEVTGLAVVYSGGQYNLTWTNPANSVARQISARKQGEAVWEVQPATKASTSYGLYGFEEGYTYEFLVQNMCSLDAGLSPGVMITYTFPVTTSA